MKTIGSFNAKTHLSDLLEQVAQGETFVITKRGKPMATLAPMARLQGPKDIIAEYRREFASSLGKFSTAEINELKEAGRR